MKKKSQWQVFTNPNPKLSPGRGQLRLVVDNEKGGPLVIVTADFSDSLHLWTATPLKAILKTIKTAEHPAALNALQKLTVNHERRLEIMMALFEARSKLYKKGA